MYGTVRGLTLDVLTIESYGLISIFQELKYGPTDRDREEAEIFWNDLDRVADRVSNVYRLC